MMTANEARIEATTILDNKAARQLVEVEKAIRIAVKEGKLSTFFYEHLDVRIKNQLTTKGYDVKNQPDRDGPLIVISW